MTGFQRQVNVQPAPAVEGDFASVNPRYTVLAGPGALVAGFPGATVARFGWLVPPNDPNNAPGSVITAGGIGPVAGLIHREMQAMITTYLAESGMVVPAGFPLTVFSGGDFWVMNRGIVQALPGMKAFAAYADGSASFAATGTTPATVAAVTAYIEPGTFSVTGAIADDVFTVTNVGSGTVVAGATITGGATASGTKIGPQLSGTAGGVGAYRVSIGNQTVASATITGTYGLAHVSAVASGAVGIGDVWTGGGITAGTTVRQQLTGAAGGVGDYAVDPTQTAGSSGAQVSTTVLGGIETKWIAMSAALPGALVKISSQPLG